MTQRKQAARAVADITEGVVLATVDIDVPPERVFKALTTSELTKWWGSAELYRTTKFEIDLKPGGRWRTEGVGADGSPFHVEGEVLEVDAPHRLVQTWKQSWDAGPATTITYTLAAIPTGTRVTVRHTGFVGRAQSCEGHSNGWARVLDWLGGHLAAAPADVRHFFVRLISPRPTFMQDMTPDERAIMQEHGMYWRGKLAEGVAVAFGPVVDPKGPWGLGLINARDEAEVRAFEAADPAKTKLGMHYEILPMFTLVHAGT
jgi:uncharacterized protein YndB with AHSA1/START domain